MKILIADDEYLYREFLAAMLAQWPEHQVTAVENGTDAWQLLDDPRRYFDVVFLDYKMPGLNGLEVLKRVRSSPMLQNTAIIMCTSQNDRATILKAIALGTKHYIVKPYDEVIVAEKLRLIGATIPPFPASDTDTEPENSAYPKIPGPDLEQANEPEPQGAGAVPEAENT